MVRKDAEIRRFDSECTGMFPDGHWYMLFWSKLGMIAESMMHNLKTEFANLSLNLNLTSYSDIISCRVAYLPRQWLSGL